jgi:hypothetical protein
MMQIDVTAGYHCWMAESQYNRCCVWMIDVVKPWSNVAPAGDDQSGVS